jgi:BlaI family transcriptional regulator, penicillinase repressor
MAEVVAFAVNPRNRSSDSLTSLNAVRTVLRRLEEKGYITHTVNGRTYVYDAAEPRGRVAAKAVQRIVDWICNGSVEEVLVGMVDSKMIDRRQLRRLLDSIDQPKAARK